MQIEDDEDCFYDYLILVDGSGEGSPDGNICILLESIVVVRRVLVKGSPLTPRICDDNGAGIDAGFKVSTNSSLVTVLFDADDSESGRGFMLRKS